jgi:hypothetical protein
MRELTLLSFVGTFSSWKLNSFVGTFSSGKVRLLERSLLGVVLGLVLAEFIFCVLACFYVWCWLACLDSSLDEGAVHDSWLQMDLFWFRDLCPTVLWNRSRAVLHVTGTTCNFITVSIEHTAYTIQHAGNVAFWRNC